jgi:hypothetical protein
MKHAEELRFRIKDIVLYKFILLFVAVIDGYLCTTTKNRGYFPDLWKVYPDGFCDGKETPS